jgi:predicted permease
VTFVVNQSAIRNQEEGEMLQDLRYGVRILLKNPGFTLIAVFTMALGIGATTAMFSFVDAALFKPLAYRAPERLVMAWERLPDGGKNMPDIASFKEWRAQNRLFSQIAATTSGGGLNLTGREVAERMRGEFVSANYFELLGVQPALGRAFSADEEQAGKEHVAVLSNRCWTQRFGADPAALNRAITLNNESYTVIGVLPPHSIFDRSSTEVWLPLVFTPERVREGSRFMVLGRLKAGVAIEQADAELKRITEGMSRGGLMDNKNVSALVQPLRSHLVNDSRRNLLLLLMGAVLFILLIACVNVANLLLARASARQGETSIRAALGAGRLRLMRQFLTESLLLSVIGGSAGVLLAFWLIKGFTALMPRFTLPAETEVALDWRILLFTAGVSLLAGLIFSLAPAWQASRVDLTKKLQERGYGSSARLGRNRLRSLMLVSEIALTFVLVIGASLLIRSFVRLLQVESGFQTERILTFQTDLDQTRYPQAHQLIDYQTELLNRMRALPGVGSVAATNSLPLSGYGLNRLISIPGRSPGAAPVNQGVGVRIISPGYFSTFGISLLQGRLPSDQDTARTPPVILINQRMARRHWPDRDPTGMQVYFRAKSLSSISYTIIGVVPDLKHMRLERETEPEVYLLASQLPEMELTSYWRNLQFAVRTTNDSFSLIENIRAIAGSIDRDQPLYGIKTMEQMYSDSMADPRFRTFLFAIFGALALALAAIGIYGVTAYSVTQRTHEIGIRMALGAQTGDVMRLVMRHGLVLVSAGIGLGVVAAIALTRFLSGFLYEVRATDIPTYIGVALILSGVALAANYVPARRATRVDPLASLRHE